MVFCVCVYCAVLVEVFFLLCPSTAFDVADAYTYVQGRDAYVCSVWICLHKEQTPNTTHWRRCAELILPL